MFPSNFSSAVPSGSGAFLMPSCPSSVCPSRLRGGGGGGVYLRNASVTFFFSSAVPPGSGAFQMPTRPSSSASTLRGGGGGGGGKGQSQKRFSNFFSFFA